MRPWEVVRVFPVGNSWLVTWRGGNEQLSFDGKQAAITFATERARKLRPCTVTVIDKEGETEYELTF
jgi:hypothetical protein